MPINSKQKGKRGELEWAKTMRDHGWDAKRTQQFMGSVDSFDVVSDDHPIPKWEVKRDNRLNLFDAMDKSREEAEGKPFALAWRKDQKKWLVVLDASLYFELMENAYNANL